MKKILYILTAVLFVCTVAYAASDIDGHWAGEEIRELDTMGVMTGDGEGLYMPDREITRAEFVCSVLRAIGAQPSGGDTGFSDVGKSDFYAPYIKRALELGIVSGFEDGTFRPHTPLSREEAMVIMSRAFGFLAGYTAEGSFSDYNETTEGAKSAFAFALRKGIVNGYPDGTLRPKATITRAEAAVLLIGGMKLEMNEPGFVIGYPRLAKTGEYGTVTLEISTNMPCNIYYALYDTDMLGTPAKSSVNKLLVSTVAGNRQITSSIACEIGKEYNVYLVAVTADGRSSRLVKLEGMAALPYDEGEGTVSNPYGIYTAEQLSAIRYFNDRAFALKSDITLSGEWKPIGDFFGILDGQGHRIDGLNVNTEENYAGLFKRISRGEIKNLTVDGRVRAHNNAGIFAGEILDASIKYCVASGSVAAGVNNAGGFFGESAGRVENCLSAVYLVEASAFAGGITGQNYGIISNSISAAHTVSANMYAGGVSAVNVGGRIVKNVAANINVYDMMMDNCGRIATNKSGAVISGNYAYSRMRTTSASGVNQPDNLNGGDIEWDTLINRSELCSLLGWNAAEWKGGGRGEVYLIMSPKGTSEPKLQPGICEYAPVRIGNAAELLGMITNPDRHYILLNDIRFNSNIRWSVAADTQDIEAGFSGTFDGGGNTIYGVEITGSKSGLGGLFGVISGGTVRNLRLYGTKISGCKLSGVIAAVNDGTIENCSVDDFFIEGSADSAYIGGISAYNYGGIISSEAHGTINSSARNTVAGGICAHNEGFVDDIAFIGTIKTGRTDGLSESVAGGICGYNSGGMLYNGYASANIRQQATTVYGGGICAIQNEGEVYKCSARGSIVSEPPQQTIAAAYVGGVCGLAASGILLHSFSASDIKLYTAKSYAGGVCGYNEAGIIQSCYSVSPVLQTANDTFPEETFAYAGGVCGFNERGTIASTVAVNSTVAAKGAVGRICAGGAAERVHDNFAADMDIASMGDGVFAGTTLNKSRLNTEYFTRPLSDGGVLGWSAEIWKSSDSLWYNLPVLADVRYQAAFVN